MGRLHGLLHHLQQLRTQLVQVHLIAQRGTESSHDLRCIIFAAIEAAIDDPLDAPRSEEHTSELQSHLNLVCRLLLEKKKKKSNTTNKKKTPTINEVIDSLLYDD